MANYIVKQIDNKSDWDKFLRQQPYNIFVQNSAYGDFNQSMNDESFILGLYDQFEDKRELVGGSQIIIINAKRGKFFYLPYGPILDYTNQNQLNEFFTELKQIAQHKGVNFIRISPFTEDSKNVRSNLKTAGFKKAPMHMIAEHTWMLDLEQDELDILKNMNQNHRNLVRRAQRDGVKVVTSEEVLDVKILHELLQETAKKHNFTPFSLKYLENEFKTFQNRQEAKLYFAYHEEDLLGAAMILFNGNSAVYRHGASSTVKYKMPSSYAIQWQAIQDAKARGLKYYNFWGIAPEGNKKHPFYGITHFKKGFGGFKLDLVPAHDLAVNSKYWINWFIETIRKYKRGF
jgi:lipid II:glycine glycyltransferase (peptidoglycan interpeptide bridge formation enzyme)